MLRWLVIINIIVWGLAACASTSESDSDGEAGMCFGLCYWIKVAHDIETENKPKEEVKND